MKSCPQCHRSYSDDTLRFCLEDGALLSASLRPGIAQPAQTARRNDPQTEVLTVNPLHAQPTGPRTFPAYLFYILASLLAVSILLLIMGVGVVVWLKIRGGDTPTASNRRSNESEQRGKPTPSASPYADTLSSRMLGTWSWSSYMQTFSTGGRGIYYQDGKACFNFSYEVKGDVMHMVADPNPQCAYGIGGDYRLSISGDSMRQEYIENGYLTQWRRVR